MDPSEAVAWSDLYFKILEKQYAHAYEELREWIKLVYLVDPETEFGYQDVPCHKVLPKDTKITLAVQELKPTGGEPSEFMLGVTPVSIDSPPINVIIPENLSQTIFPHIIICMLAIRDNRPPCWFWVRVTHKEFAGSTPVVETDLKIIYSAGGVYIEGPSRADAISVIEWMQEKS